MPVPLASLCVLSFRDRVRGDAHVTPVGPDGPMNPLDIEATPLRLRELVRRRVLPPDRFADAIDVVSGPDDPRRVLQRVLLVVGAALVVAGIAFFVAANWQGLGRFARLGLVCGGVVVAGGIGVVVGPRTIGGRAATSIAGLVCGPALFLFGQTYQTGADAWQLFAGWLILLVPFALAARFAGVWWVALLLLHTALALCLMQRFDMDNNEGISTWLPLLVVIDVGALAIADVVAKRRSHRRALPRGVAVILTITACAAVTIGVFCRHLGVWPLVDLVVACGSAVWLVLRRRGDLMRAALGLFTLCFAFCVIVGRLIFEELRLDLGGVFLQGAIVLIVVGGASALLRHWHRTSGAHAEDEP